MNELRRSMVILASQFDRNLALRSGRIIEVDGQDAQLMLSVPRGGPVVHAATRVVRVFGIRGE